MQQCKFCNKNVEQLKISHIIPKFFYDWLKKGSTLKRMRTATSKQPVQDGYKIEFLCGECEVDFSKYEKYCAEKIFRPLTNDISFIDIFKNINFDMFNKFLASLLWRASMNSLNNPQLNGNYKEDEKILFNKYTNKLKDSYKDNVSIDFNTYIIPLTEEFVNKNILKLKNYAYYERSIGMDFIIFDDFYGQASILIKLPFLLIVCEFISSKEDNWKGFKINNKEIEFSDYYNIPEYIHKYMEYNCQQGYDIVNNLPEHQLKKLIEMAQIKIKEDDDTFKAIKKNIEYNIQ
jgi:hypothetical protein